jgi:hypothetical protein
MYHWQGLREQGDGESALSLVPQVPDDLALQALAQVALLPVPGVQVRASMTCRHKEKRDDGSNKAMNKCHVLGMYQV